jgi:uncharacterized glyoxalase superfamily protein PhnB
VTATPSVSAAVEVGVDPATAFTAFTEELDLWWVRGPINFFDAARAVAMRCEQGVGGRLLEVYDEAAGDVLELGRITVWEPGTRLAWRSSLDDVTVEVRFEATAGGTTVRVEARTPPGGQDRGGTAWVRVTPPWFGAWCARRDSAPRERRDLARLGVAVYYARPVAAARWLADVFGFESPNPLPDDQRGSPWIEFRVGNSSLMVFGLDNGPPDGAPATHVPWVYVDDLDAHFNRARDAGATIVEGIRRHGYRSYVAEDLEGYRWTIAQARPTMD